MKRAARYTFLMRWNYCVVVLAILWTSTLRAADRPPNIVHIVADDVGYDDLSCYGAPKIKTPNLDKLASQGIRLTSFYAPSPVCTASRAAMITGCYAQRVGLDRVLFPNDHIGISDHEITIAQLLKQHGYATALIGKWHLGSDLQFLPQHHGFDLYYGIPYPNDHGPERTHLNGQTEPFPAIPVYRNDTIVEQPADLPSDPDKFTDEAIKFITDNKDRPFFLHLANIETHTPWFVPKRAEGHSVEGPFGDAVEYLDGTVGRVMETLDKLGLADNTLVVFCSDNGPLWQRAPELEGIYGKYGTVDLKRPHLLKGGKYTSRWEGGVRVPMIARWPGKIPAGKTSDQLAMGFDLFTTFAMLGGSQNPTDRIIDGRDILPLLKSEPGAKSPHDFYYYYEDFKLTGVRGPVWKLTLPDKQHPGTFLYDVQQDLGEKNDRLADEPRVVSDLRKIAEQAYADLGDSFTKRPGQNRRPPGESGG